MSYVKGTSYLSKEELLKAIGEEPIVEDENDKVQIAMVLQYRKFMDIINSLPTHDISFNEDRAVDIEINKRYDYSPKQFGYDFTGEWVSYNDKISTGDITKIPKDWRESLL